MNLFFTALIGLNAASTATAQDANGCTGKPLILLWSNRETDYVDTLKFAKESPYVFGFLSASVSIIWRVGILYLIKQVAAGNNNLIEKLLITDANNDPAKQVSEFHDPLQRSIDILTVLECSPICWTLF